MQTILKSATEAAKRVRVELKHHFPNTKFRVRTSYFSMGNSIDVSWDLGPTTRQVDAIIGKYQEGSFDGMTDSYNYEPTLVLTKDNEVAELGGAKYVHSHRSAGSQFDQMCEDYCAALGLTYEGPNTRDPQRNEWVSTLVHRLMSCFDLTNGYQGIRQDPNHPQAGTLEEFYEMIGGTRVPRS